MDVCVHKHNLLMNSDRQFLQQIHCVLMLCMMCTELPAQWTGALDQSFGANDPGFGLGDGLNGTPNDIALFPDGRALIVGEFNSYDRIARENVCILNPDGSLDPTLHFEGGIYGYIYTCAIQPDGRILLGGQFDTLGGYPLRDIARLWPDGSVDTTFHVGSGTGLDEWWTAHVLDIAVLPDGRILVGGQFGTMQGEPLKSMARLLPDGSLDPTFHLGLGFDGYQAQGVRALVPLADGDILAGGDFREFDGAPSKGIVRLNEDGSRDTAFQTGGGFEHYMGSFFGGDVVTSLALLPDGKVVVGGQFSQYNGAFSRNIAVLLPTGELDPEFEPGTAFGAGVVDHLAVRSDSLIVACHSSGTYNGQPVRGITWIEPDGDPATAFTSPLWSGRAAMALRPDGTLLIGTYSWEGMPGAHGHILQLQPNGQVDHEFAPGSGATSTVYELNIGTDGATYIAGTFKYVDGNWRPGIARLQVDGSLDPSFDPGPQVTSTGAEVLLQPDGRVLVTGLMENNDPNTIQALTRLWPDGTKDSTFHTDLYWWLGINEMAIRPDGGILCVGGAYPWETTAVKGVVQLLPDGSIDPSFTVGTGTIDLDHYPDSITPLRCYAAALQPDGRAIVGGEFRMMNGLAAYGIVRLMPDGAVDTSFHTGSGFAPMAFFPDSILPYYVHELALQPDGRILVAGYFSYYDGEPCPSVVRLMPDGSLDSSFNAGSATTSATTVLLLPDGSLLVAGYFDTYNGVLANDIVHLFPDGTLDPDFSSGAGCTGGSIRTMALYAENNVLIAGDFVSYNGIGRNRFARLSASTPLASPFGDDGVNDPQILIAPVPVGDQLFVHAKRPIVHLQVIDHIGRTVMLERGIDILNVSSLPPGVYVLRALMTNGAVEEARFVKL